MKRLCSLVLLLFLFTFAHSVNATNDIFGVNIDDFIKNDKSSKLGYGSEKSFVIYEITNINIDKDEKGVLIIKGWAHFTGAKDHILGGNETVQLSLKTNGKPPVDGSISYDSSGNDISKWYCIRKQNGDCLDSSQYPLYQYRGSFIARFNLDSFEEGYTYTLNLTLKDGSKNKSFVIGGSSKISSELSLQGYETDKIKMSFKNSIGSAVTIIAGRKDLIQTVPGFNSSGQADGTLKVSWNKSYSYYGNYMAMADEVYFYPIYANGKLAYVPTPWLMFDGRKFSITVSKKENPDEAEKPPADLIDDDSLSIFGGSNNNGSVTEACKNKKIYNFYYYFLAGVNDLTGNTFITEGQNLIFSDSEIFSSGYLEDTFTNNSEMASAWTGDNGQMGSIVYIKNREELQDFYNKLKTILSTRNKWWQEDSSNFHITHLEWIDKKSGQKKPNTTSIENASDITDYMNATINVYNQDGLSIIKADNSSSLGFNFIITRRFASVGTTQRYASMLNPNVQAGFATFKNSDGSTFKERVHPALYRVSFCKSDEPDCKDDIQGNKCNPTDTGSKIVYHENNDLKSCTLNNNTHSGFTIVDKEETTNSSGKSYCEVACKDDLDIDLPGTKFTEAGQYYKLDNYTPEINAKRTCVTTKIDYDAFDKDLKYFENQSNLPTKYNDYQDYLDIYKWVMNDNNSRITSSGTDSYSCNCSTDDEGNESCDEGTYYWENWEIDGKNAINYSSHNYSGASDYYEESTPCTGTGTSYNDAISSVRSEYARLTSDAHRIYNNELVDYQTTMNAFNRCFGWMDQVRFINYKRSSWDRGAPSISILRPAYSGYGNYGLAVSSNPYKFTFYPTVKFKYEDPDNIFSDKGYTYTYNDDMNGPYSPTTNKTYWIREETTIDNNYSSGQTSSMHKQERNILICEGETCNSNNNLQATYFYDHSYLKREETIHYKYELPKIYTKIPNGGVVLETKLTKSNNSSIPKTYLKLEDEAVPVNINTKAGTYPYTITVSDLKDNLRRDKYDKNPNDDWADVANSRFVKNRVISTRDASENYVCDYNVTNDIYIPKSGVTFFYRIVDPSNVNPNNRELGRNWNDADERAPLVKQRMKEDDESYDTLTGKNNEQPAERKTNRDRFVFTLTPTIMKEIRRYNGQQTTSNGQKRAYMDWDLACYDYDKQNNSMSSGYHCYSTFLNCLTGGSSAEETSCDDIFGNTLNGYVNRDREGKPYDFSDLEYNRQILIKKQNRLDCNDPEVISKTEGAVCSP